MSSVFLQLLIGLIPLLAWGSAAQSAFASPSQLTRQDAEAWFDGVVPASLRAHDIAGAVVVVVKDGQILLSKGYGHADAAERKPVDPDQTLFRVGSVSKLFTATAVMQLVEQGKIDLDADINTYLDFPVVGRGGKKITVRHLLTHRAGFEEGYKQSFVYERIAELTSTSFLKRWVPMRIFDPGTTPAYSNYGVSLAGYIVERVSGLRFETYVARNIFAPLGMTHSTVQQPLPGQLQPMMSKGYVLGSEPPHPFEIVMVPGAGGVSASGSDMGKFMLAHLNNGQLGSARLLQPATVQLMHSSAIDTIQPLHRMNLGFYESNINGHRVIGHGGNTLFFHSNLSLFIDDGVGVYLSLNSAGKGSGEVEVHRAVSEGFADRYFPSAALQPTLPHNAANDASAIAGEYRSSRRSASNFLSIANLGWPINVAVGENGTVTFMDKKYLHIGPLLWRTVDGKNRLAAAMSDGKVKWITTDAYAPIIVFEPLPASQSASALIPLGIGALAVVLIAAASWPIAAALRRHYRQPLLLRGQARTSYRLSRFFATALLGLIILWGVILNKMIMVIFPPDSVIIAMQIGLLVCVSGMAISAIWLIKTVPKPRGFGTSLFGFLLIAASAILLWIFSVFGFFNFTSNY
jgi:CubicO group peptidase (beta-lactamase class C family)